MPADESFSKTMVVVVVVLIFGYQFEFSRVVPSPCIMGNELVEFVIFIAKVFREIIRASLDIVCLVLWIFALAAPWRTYWVAQVLCKVDSRGDYEFDGFIQACLVVCDLIVLPFGLLGLLFPWNWYAIFKDVGDRDSDHDIRYNAEVRFALLTGFGYFCTDVVCLPAFLVVVCTLIRIPAFIRDVKEKAKWEAYSWDLRKAALANCGLMLVDIIFVPSILILLVTGLRTRIAFNRFRRATSDNERRTTCLAEMWALFLDLFFVPMLLVLLLTGYRVPHAWREYMKIDTAVVSRNYADEDRAWRTLVFFEFLYILRDIPLFIMSIIICGTLYRLQPFVSGLLVAAQKPLEPRGKGMIHLVSITPLFQEGSIRLRFVGEKLSPTTSFRNPRLQVLGSEFWARAASRLGSVVSVGRAMLPLKLSPKYLDINEINVHDSRVVFELDFKAITKPKSIWSTFDKIGAYSVILSFEAEVDGHNSFVGSMVVHLTDLKTAAAQKTCLLAHTATESKVSPDTERGITPFGSDKDATVDEPSDFWNVAFPLVTLLVFKEILTDLLMFVLFWVSLLMPHRWLGCMVLLFEARPNWAIRTQLKAIEIARCARWHVDRLMVGFQEQGMRVVKLENVPDKPWCSRWWYYYGRGLHELFVDACVEGNLWRCHGQPYTATVKSARKMSLSAPTAPSQLPQYFSLETARLAVAAMAVEVDVCYATSKLDVISRKILLQRVEELRKDTAQEAAKGWELIEQRERELQRSLSFCGNADQKKKKCLNLRPVSECREMIVASALLAVADILMILCVLFLLLTAFRFPGCVRDLRVAKGLDWYRSVLFWHSKQMCIDIGYAFLFLCTFILLVKAPELVVESLGALGDVHDGRRVIRHYARKSLYRLYKWIWVLSLWKLYKFFVATMLFGLLVPFETVNLSLKAVSPQSSKCLRLIVSVLTIGGLCALPSVLVAVAPQALDAAGLVSDPSQIRALTGVFLGLLMLLVVLSWGITLRAPLTKIKSNPMEQEVDVMLAIREVERQRDPGEFQRSLNDNRKEKGLKWDENAGVDWVGPLISYLQILLQSLQLCAFAILASDSRAHWIRAIAGALLLNAPGWFEPCFWVGVGLVCCWYVVISMPVVVEDLMEWKDKGYIANSPWWPNAVSLFGSTFYMLTVFSIMKPLGCIYPATMVPGTSLHCWSADHRSMALTGALMLVFYLSTVHVLRPLTGEAAKVSRGSLRYPTAYVSFTQTMFVILSAIVILLGSGSGSASDNSGVLASVVVISVSLLAWTLAYRFLFGSPACSDEYGVVLRCTGFATSLIVAIVGLAVPAELGVLEIQGILVLVLLGVGAVAASITRSFSEARRKSSLGNASEDRWTRLVRDMGALEATMRREKLLMVGSWTDARSKSWRLRLQEANFNEDLARLLLELERFTEFGALPTQMYCGLLEWRASITPSGSLEFEAVAAALEVLETSVELAAIDCTPLVPRPLVRQLESCLLLADFGKPAIPAPAPAPARALAPAPAPVPVPAPSSFMAPPKAVEWSCPMCTYINKAATTRCSMCHTERPATSATPTAVTATTTVLSLAPTVLQEEQKHDSVDSSSASCCSSSSSPPEGSPSSPPEGSPSSPPEGSPSPPPEGSPSSSSSPPEVSPSSPPPPPPPPPSLPSPTDSPREEKASSLTVAPVTLEVKDDVIHPNGFAALEKCDDVRTVLNNASTLVKSGITPCMGIINELRRLLPQALKLTEESLPKNMPLDLVKIIIGYGGEEKALNFYQDSTVVRPGTPYSKFWRRVWYLHI